MQKYFSYFWEISKGQFCLLANTGEKFLRLFGVWKELHFRNIIHIFRKLLSGGLFTSLHRRDIFATIWRSKRVAFLRRILVGGRVVFHGGEMHLFSSSLTGSSVFSDAEIFRSAGSATKHLPCEGLSRHQLIFLWVWKWSLHLGL